MKTIIDLIIYAHDGRGLGHVSRSIAIGLAARRLYPDMSVLLVTGCAVTGELIGEGGLDWIKLPSYKTKISEGKSSGTEGPSNIKDKLLGELRAVNIRDIIDTYRPKVFLADHTPQGKHKELIPSHSVSPDTIRVLGVRAVVGDVDKVWSSFSAEVFASAYSKILWYGDEAVAGSSEISRIEDSYGVIPYRAGYVSRLSELCCLKKTDRSKGELAGVISIPWSGEGTVVLLEKLARVLRKIGSQYGVWKIYMNLCEPAASDASKLFSEIDSVHVVQVGPKYLDDLAYAKCALIYGGYNSLTDVMVSGVPSVVLLRGMKDGEQEEHASLLKHKSSVIVDVFSECGVTVEALENSFVKCFEEQPEPCYINLNGAENAAHYLASLAGVCDADSKS